MTRQVQVQSTHLPRAQTQHTQAGRTKKNGEEGKEKEREIEREGGMRKREEVVKRRAYPLISEL